MVKLCNERGADVLFLKVPSCGWTSNTSDAVEKLVTETGCRYFDMAKCEEEIGIERETDFWDPVHLNTKGADKTTDYLAQYLLKSGLIRNL